MRDGVPKKRNWYSKHILWWFSSQIVYRSGDFTLLKHKLEFLIKLRDIFIQYSWFINPTQISFHFNLLTLIYFNALFPTIKVAIAIKITIIQGEIYLKEVEVAAIKSDLALPKRVLTVKISPLASREIRLYRCFHQNSLVFGWNSLPMFRRWCWRRPDFQWRLGNRWLLGLLQGTFLLGEESSGKWILLAHKKHQ